MSALVPEIGPESLCPSSHVFFLLSVAPLVPHDLQLKQA